MEIYEKDELQYILVSGTMLMLFEISYKILV